MDTPATSGSTSYTKTNNRSVSSNNKRRLLETGQKDGLEEQGEGVDEEEEALKAERRRVTL